jgi:hypothetical protein
METPQLLPVRLVMGHVMDVLFLVLTASSVLLTILNSLVLMSVVVVRMATTEIILRYFALSVLLVVRLAHLLLPVQPALQ